MRKERDNIVNEYRLLQKMLTELLVSLQFKRMVKVNGKGVVRKLISTSSCVFFFL